MNTRRFLLNKIEAFRERHGMSRSQFGQAVSGHHNLIPRIERGLGSFKTIEKAEAFMTERDRQAGFPVEAAESLSAAEPAVMTHNTVCSGGGRLRDLGADSRSGNPRPRLSTGRNRIFHDFVSRLGRVWR